ncbi:histidine kinase [Cobetia sp. 14N.309.X.WAT.E.A4]|uniref:sensor histidine kinase n=1 Tax=Cobetia sp. 14N.309.X.WAT.E.A4 TaxID=2998323 RepID=UPI0025B14926|nr:histidine kinase [Cobetia sp. 14N.309.X.WAT.E.A4]MDN2656607.1 histidine kinase [Cobetia sp. 14N.309.X.WAT.E.A4]
MALSLGASKTGKAPASQGIAHRLDVQRARGCPADAETPVRPAAIPPPDLRDRHPLDAITLRIATCADLEEALPSVLRELLDMLNGCPESGTALSATGELCVVHRAPGQATHAVISPVGLALSAAARERLQEVVWDISRDPGARQQVSDMDGTPGGVLIALTDATDRGETGRGETGKGATGDDWLWLGEPTAAVIESGLANVVINTLSRGLALHHQQQARHAEDTKSAVAQALKNERRQLAAELHDTLAQELSYLQMQSARLTRAARHAPQEVQALAEEVHTQARRAFRQTRELINGAHATWGDAPLACVLEALIEEFETRSSMVFELDNRIQSLHLPDALSLQVMFIVREAMTNSVRHARATHLRLQLLYQSSGPQPAARVLLTIEDNGCGFDPAEIPAAHFGLGIMQDRARHLGAEFAITQPRQGGTRVTLSWERRDT